MEHLILRTNLRNGAVTQYSNYNFDSFCRFGGVCLACGESGIYTIGGSDDDGTEIDGLFKTMTMDFGSDMQKRLRSLFIGGEWGGWLKVSIAEDEGEAREYLTPPLDSGNLQEGNKVAVGRDGKGRYWNFQVENVEGCDFSVDSIDALVILLNRRMSGWRHTENIHGKFEEEDLPVMEVDAEIL